MQVDFSDGRGNVYRTSPKGTHLVKLSFRRSGVYINKIRVVPSKDDPGDWIVYLPAYKSAKGWKSDFECSKSGPVWKIIEELAIKTVRAYDGKDEVDDDGYGDLDDFLSKGIDDFLGQ